MNSIGINSIISYLSSNGIIASWGNASLISAMSNANSSHKAFIMALAQLIKSKSITSPQMLSLSIYNQFIAKDNLDLIRTFKRMMTLHQRNQRRTLIKCYCKWKMCTLREDNGSYDHFDFMITKDTVHDRLYNHYKTREVARRKMENQLNASESENCTFIPTINHNYTSNIIHNRAKSNKQMIIDSSNIIDSNWQANNNNNNNGNQLFYLSTNPNTARATNKSHTNICMTASNRKVNSESSKHIRFRRSSKSNSSRREINSSNNHLIKYESNTEGKPYLTNQSSFNNLIIPNQNHYLINNSSSKSSSVNLFSNGPSTKPKTPRYSIGDYMREGSSKESFGRLYKELSAESLALRYQKRNNNKHLLLKSYDNSSSINLQDKGTDYISHQDNKSKQYSLQESQANSKGTKKNFTIPINQGQYTASYKDFGMTQTNPLLFPKQSNHRIEKIKYLNKSGNEYNNNNNNNNSNSNSNNTKRIHYSSVNSNGSNMPFNTQSAPNKNKTPNIAYEGSNINNNLKISSGVTSEYLGVTRKDNSNNNNQMNTVYTNQITLQTISDSKLYDIANHYITTDESLDKYSCSYRKCHHKKY